MIKRFYILLLAIVASVGMMNAKVTWNSSNISDLNVYATYESYSKEGVTLGGNADQIRAEWYDYGDESMNGIEFRADETGGFTFSNTLGKNFTKVEMTLTGPGGWDMANLGSGWSFSWDFMNDKPATVTWTGNASTVDLLKDESNLHGEKVKSIVFYFVGDSEAPDPTYTVALKDGTANADKVTLSATSVAEGATVTVTPDDEYEITAFSAYYVVVEDQLGSIYDIDATLNAETGAYSFTMPAYAVTIEATIAAKPVPEGDIYAGFTATAGSGGFDNEGSANLVDNKFISSDWTKWCTNDGHKSVPTGESESCWWIDFEASAALYPTGYILTTGNDTGSEHGRNPKNWVLKAKLNAGDAWTTIATVTNDVTMKNKSFKDYKFFVDQSGSYKYFRFEVFANQGASVMQLCQLRLIGTDTPAPAPATTVTWNSSNISNLTVNGSSYSKEGVTLSPNASNNYAYWLDYGNESQNGIYFYVNATGGFTFSNSLGKNFTKIEMTLNGLDGWNMANLGSGWNIDGMKAIWTGNAATVDLLKETSSFGGAAGVKSIVFYFEGGSEEPGGGSTDVIPCTAADLGKVLCTDGSIYATVSEATAASKTAAAMIAYVDTENGKALALALADDGDEMNWATAKTTAAAHTPAVSGGTWTLASKDDWNNMITAAGSYTALRDGFSGVGGTNMLVAEYWTSTEGTYSGTAIGYRFQNGKWTDPYVDDPLHVRACLAFDIPATPAYETVMNLINEIPNPVVLTTECKAKIDAAREAYDALSAADKDLVTNYTTLTTAEAAFEKVMNIWLSGDCDAILWNDTTLTVRKHAGEGNGAMADYNYMSRAPWYSAHWYDPQPSDIVIKSVTIEEGVTHLGDYAFAWMSEMKTATIPSSVTTIPEDAFYWSKAVDDIYLTVADTANLTWALPYSADNQFKPSKATLCHVPADLLTAYQEKFDALNMTFVGDLDPITPLTPEQQQALDAAKGLINAIPSPVVYTPACKDAIDAARAAYDALTPDMLKQLVSNYATLTAAEATYANLKDVAVVEAKIAAIPTQVTLKLATRDSIENARAAFDALTADQQALVSNYDVLTAAEAALAALNPGGGMPAGALNGKFTINADGDQIAFSKGNLQATTTDLGANWTWGFAANQWDLIGNAAANNAVNGNKTVSANGTVDLFGWSTPTTYYGIHNSTNSDYYSSDFREWGENITGATWKTLSPSDWIYIISNRADAAQKHGQATVNGVNGYIFLPDEWELPSGLSFTAKPNNWTANVYDGDDWTAMENAGAVFLPKSPWRSGNTVNTLAYGYYWSSDYNNYSNAMAYYFKEDASITGTGTPRYAGICVRLVTADAGSPTPLDSAQAVKDLIEAIPTPVEYPTSGAAIEAALNAFNELSDAAKGALDDADVQKLNDAEDAYAALIKEATDVIALINAIPQPVVYNEACGDSIAAAREAYDALSDELKPLVTNYSVLTDAEATYEALAPRIWTSGDCQVIYWPGDSAMIVSKLPGEGNGVMDNYANKNSVPWVDYQLKVKTLTIESGVTEIGSCAFYELRNLEGGLVIPEGVTAIHENGFRNCLKLTSITLPSTITLLGDNADAFNNCKAANISITADPNKLAWNEDFDDFIYSYSQQDVHKTTVCHVPVDFYEIYVAKFDQTVNVTFVGDLPAALSPAEHAAIEAVKDSIAAIGAEISYPESGAAIDAARSAYDALDDDLKPFVSNYQTLLDAEDAYADAKQAHDAVAAAVVDKINAIPVPVEYSSKAAIDTARVAYDALLDTQKALITPEQLKVLTDAEAAWAAIAAKVEHNVTYIGKDGELKNEKVALLHIPDPAPDFNGYEFVRWDVKAGDFLAEGLRIKAVYTPIITTNPVAYDSLMYNGTAQTLITAGVAKEGHIEYRINDGEWSAELPQATFAATYVVYYKLVREGHADYIADSIVATIAKAPVTYTAPTAVENLVYTASNQTLIAAGQTNDGTFEYSLDPTLMGSWKKALPQAKDAGTYSVYYRVQGDLNHLDSTAVDPIAVTIAKAELTATADDKNVIYGDAVPVYSVTYTGWQGDDDATVLTGDLAFACEYASTSNVGEYTITPSGVDAANYTITFVNGKVTVAKAESGCLAPVAFDTLVYNGANQTLIIAGQPMGGTMYYSLTGAAESWQTALPEAKEAGTYNVYYRVKGDGNHNDHDYDQPVAVTIAKAALTATADDKNVVYGDAVPEYTVSYSGWMGTDESSVLTGTIAFACEYAPTSNVGDYTITPSGVDAANYSITFVNGKVTVAKADLMITADDKSVIYGEVAPAFTASYSGWKNNDGESVVSGLTLTSEYLVTSNVGTYDIVPANASATNYAISYTNGTLTVNQAALTITANDTTMIYGDEHPEFTVTCAGWKNNDDASVVSGLQFSTPYAPGSYIGTYTINPNSATALNYAITFVDGTLTVNKAHVYVSDAEAQIAKFADGHANAVVLEQGVLNGIKLNDPIAHVTTAAFSSADVADNLTITLFYELTGDAALLNNYNLDPTSEIFSTEGVIIEPFIPDNEEKPEDEEATVNEGIEIYAYGYCDGSGYSLKYHLESGNPDQYKIDFEDSRFTDVDWTNLVITGKDGTIDIDIPVDMPTGDYTMTVYFRDSRFDWLESRQFNVTFHVNLPETFVRPLFDNVIALVDTCHCLTDIQWYWRANSTDTWVAIPGANGYYYHSDTKLEGEYFVSAKMNGEPTYTCGQADMETLYGAGQQAQAPVVRAYPNPVVNTTTVTIENSDNFEHNLRVVNLMGVEVINTTFEGNETNVEMSGYPQGNYMISVDGIVVKVMKK